MALCVAWHEIIRILLAQNRYELLYSIYRHCQPSLSSIYRTVYTVVRYPIQLLGLHSLCRMVCRKNTLNYFVYTYVINGDRIVQLVVTRSFTKLPVNLSIGRPTNGTHTRTHRTRTSFNTISHAVLLFTFDLLNFSQFCSPVWKKNTGADIGKRAH